jgi:hypothetical protein
MRTANPPDGPAKIIKVAVANSGAPGCAAFDGDRSQPTAMPRDIPGGDAAGLRPPAAAQPNHRQERSTVSGYGRAGRHHRRLRPCTQLPASACSLMGNCVAAHQFNARTAIADVFETEPATSTRPCPARSMPALLRSPSNG